LLAEARFSIIATLKAEKSNKLQDFKRSQTCQGQNWMMNYMKLWDLVEFPAHDEYEPLAELHKLEDEKPVAIEDYFLIGTFGLTNQAELFQPTNL
jgi:hypothetical protein